MTVIPRPMMSCPLGDDAALILRTPSIADAYHELLLANYDRLARWEPWAASPPALDQTRSFLQEGTRDWLDGSQLPLALAVRDTADTWYLAGSVGLRISQYERSAEVGYWIGGNYEGMGLMSRAVRAVLDEAFGRLGLGRVSLRADVANERSRALARRLGFTEEGVLRQALAFPGERRDAVVYSLLAGEWTAA